MTSAIDSHLRDLESEAREAEREVEEYRERTQRRIEQMNNDVAELVIKTQMEKAAIKDQLDKKQHWAKKKADELITFRESLSIKTPSLVSAASSSTYHPSSRPSVFSEANRNSMASIDDSFNASSEVILNPPKSTIKPSTTPADTMALLNLHKYLLDVPMISRSSKGSWAELRCFLCNGNYIEKKGFIKGARGMLAHVTKSHKVDTFNGQKLDSTNIFDCCTHRQLVDADVLAIAENPAIAEEVACRDVASHPHNGTKPATTASPKLTKSTSAPQTATGNPHPTANAITTTTTTTAAAGAGAGAGAGDADADAAPATEVEHDQPYDWLRKYPTIVLGKDGRWVELRCDICGGNSLANSDRRFAMGVIGFVRHLSRGHGVKPKNPTKRLEWAIERCQHRTITGEEIRALTEDLSATSKGPPKIPFKQIGNKDGLNDDDLAVTPTKRRSAKRSSDAMDISEEDGTEPDMDGRDPEFNPSNSESFKKPRLNSFPTDSPKQAVRNPSRKSLKTSPRTTSPAPVSSSTEPKLVQELDKYCPCTIGGHMCGTGDCKRKTICIQSNHDERCLNSKDAHHIKPTCIMALLGEECSDGDNCNRGHDHFDERKRIAAVHSCKLH